ncbi:MAG: dienelactone hydrolase family protein [Clostridia bacterium]|nr:dienelactone hydrolase family protein [Clostridia bacterium]
MNIVKHTDNEYGFPFIAMESDGLGEKPALIIQLHGAGERAFGGKDLDKVLIHGFPDIVNDQNLKNAVLVLPQCPPTTFWVAKIESIKAFIDRVVELYGADTDRIYICGLSMGGYGTWYTAMAYPNLFAAAAPCCGGGMAWNSGVLKMPIWAFHGLDDTTVDPFHTKEMASRLEGKNPNFKCTLYEGVAHNSWKYAFSEELLEWLLQQHK